MTLEFGDQRCVAAIESIVRGSGRPSNVRSLVLQDFGRHRY